MSGFEEIEREVCRDMSCVGLAMGDLLDLTELRMETCVWCVIGWIVFCWTTVNGLLLVRSVLASKA
jgi:hypothetical protein